MPWFAWIAIVAIVIFGGAQLLSVLTGRPLPSRDGGTGEELEELEKRLEQLEENGHARTRDEPATPTKAEENLTAQDRWRLDMLEARLESLETPDESDDGGTEGERRS